MPPRSSPDDPPAEPARIAVGEEHLVVSKRTVPEGTVRVRVETETFEDFARAELDRGIVEVKRVPVDRIIDRVPEIRTEGDLTVVPVVEEVLVVEKRLMLKEELHIRRRTETETVERPVTLRRQHVTVDHPDAAGHPYTQSESKP